MYELSIIQNPTGTFSFVGSVPLDLCVKRPATRAALVGGRAFADNHGKYWEWTCPTFTDLETALNYATKLGHTPAVPQEA
jgi:hypothetical protein